MSSLQSILKFSWHTIVVALVYMAVLIVAGIIGAMPGMQPATKAGRWSSFTLPFIASLLQNVVHAHQGTTGR